MAGNLHCGQDVPNTRFKLPFFVFPIPAKSRAAEQKHLLANKQRIIPYRYRVYKRGLG